MPSLAIRGEKIFQKVFLFFCTSAAIMQFLFIFFADSFSSFFVGIGLFCLTVLSIAGFAAVFQKGACFFAVKNKKARAFFLYGGLFALSFGVRFFLYYLPIGRHALPQSDYAFAYQVATTSPGLGAYSALFSHWFFLGEFYQGLFSLLGFAAPQVAYVVNILLDSFSILLTFHMAKKITKRQSTGIYAGLLLLFWPSYNVQLNLFSPDPFIVFIILLSLHTAMLLLEKLFQKKAASAACLALGLGLLLAALSLLKPYHIIIVVALGVVFLVKWLQSKPPKILLIIFAGLLVLTLGTYAGVNAFVVHKVETAYHYQLGSPLAYTLRTGFNFDTHGSWSSEVADFYFNTLYAHPTQTGFDYEKVNQIVNESTLEQIKTNLYSLPLLFAVKFFNAWTNEKPMVYALTEPFEATISPPLRLYTWALTTFSQLYYFAVLLLCAFTLRKNKARLLSPSFLMITVALFGFILAFLFSEVQPRYRVPLYPLLCVIGAMAIDQLPLKKPLTLL